MQKRFLTIWFRHLKTDWVSRRQPSLKDIPFALAEQDHGRKVITAVNAIALSKGVHPGMVVADARAMIHGLQVSDDQPGIEQKVLKNICLWCIQFTPVVAIDLPDGIILDVTGCTHLWKGETPYINDITRKLKNFGYNVNAAISDTIGCSWAMSRFCKGNTIIRPGDHMNELLSMPPEALRFESESVERLHKLGLRQLKDFIRMPRQSLRRRFGEYLLKRIDQALGYEEEYFDPVQPIEPYEERLPCLEPIITLTGIEIALQRLLETMCARLAHEKKGLRNATLTAFMSDGKMQKMEISTSYPSHNATHLFKLFELKFSTFNPEPGIELFLLCATRLEEIVATQELLWNTQQGVSNKDLAELLDRLTTKYGNGHIKRFLPDEHFWPERSFKEAQSIDEQTAVQWNVSHPRPLVMLEKPESIEVTAPVPDYPPMNFRHKGVLHKITKADGPERIEQEWWIEEGQHRDYYYVEDEEGKRYWLFRSGHYDANKSYTWFLHGYFS